MKKMAVVLMLLIAGCANYRPIVDMKNVNRYQYEQDLKECQEYAKQISPGTNAAVGAGAGAGIGALLGLVVGIAFNVDPGDMAGAGAAIGGLQGAGVGAAEGAKSQMEIIKNCMSGRGYRVLR
ncbi:MAG: hypothetical protein AB7S77_13400 [Desulfatirhabdiaceae bacterium]